MSSSIGGEAEIFCMDVGTSSIKAGLISESGRLVWFCHESVLGDPTMLETWDARIWERALVAITRKLWAERPQSRPSAIAMSGNGPTLVPVDRDNVPVWNTLLWLDRKKLALPGTVSFYLPKIAWLMASHPEIYERTDRFLSCPEYLNTVLTGESWTIAPNEDFVPYLWSPDEVERYRIDPDKLPPFVYPGHVVGHITSAASEVFGFKAGLPVYSGGSDFLMSLAGTGTIEAGLTCDRAGSSEGINHCTGHQVNDVRVRTLPHLVDGLWNIAGILSSTGMIFEWYRGLTGQKDRPYDTILSEIRNLPMSDHYPLFFPNHQRSASWEFSQGMFLNLRAEHGVTHMGRAVVESIGFAVREAVEVLETLACKVIELRVCGGQAKNDDWNHMKADITGKILAIPEVKDAELLGNAMMAGIGMGHFRNITEAAAAMVRIEKRIEPDLSSHQAFSEGYERYRDFAEQLTRNFPKSPVP